MSHFVYKLIPPRPTFAVDMTEAERAVMAQHATYWHEQLAAGRVVAFGPVSDPAGVWGLGVIEVDTHDDAVTLAREDPAIASRLATYEVHPMAAVVRR